MSQLFAGTDPQAIATAAALLRAGEVVAFPTETVYGLGADALNERAVAQVFAIKNRPRFDPLIVHVPDKDAVALYATDIDERAVALMERFWPGPLTLVLRKRPNIPDLVTAGLETVAIRVPSHPVALALLRAAQVPIAAPSANPFGYVSPTTALACAGVARRCYAIDSRRWTVHCWRRIHCVCADRITSSYFTPRWSLRRSHRSGHWPSEHLCHRRKLMRARLEPCSLTMLRM